MSRPRFLADEDFRYPIVSAVRRLEPALEIITIPERGLRGTKDAALLELAAKESLIVLSHDVNTMSAEAVARIIAGWPMPGLCLVPQGSANREVVEAIRMVWGASEAEE